METPHLQLAKPDFVPLIDGEPHAQRSGICLPHCRHWAERRNRQPAAVLSLAYRGIATVSSNLYRIEVERTTKPPAKPRGCVQRSLL